MATTAAQAGVCEQGGEEPVGVIRAWELAAVGLICVCFAAVCLATSEFPLGVHADEGRKVVLVATGQNDFFHPLLMLTLTRGVCAAVGVEDREGILAVGRGLSALSGALGVMACWRLGRAMLPAGFALAAAGLVALSPIAILHARYMKEDSFVMPWLTLSILAIAANRSGSGRPVLGGIALGLACSAKYSAFLLLVLLLLSCVATGREGRAERARVWRGAGWMVLVGVGVFGLVNVAALVDPARAVRGVSFELGHMTSSHTVALPIWRTLGVHYLRESLLPGMGWAVVGLAAAGIAAIAARWRTARPLERMLVISAVGWYLVHEALPAKPDPGSMRYMMPVAGVIAVLAVMGARDAAALAREWSGRVAAMLVVGAVAWTAALGVVAVRAGSVETRVAAGGVIEVLGTAVARERYVTLRKSDVDYFGVLTEEQRLALPRYVAVSSFSYERFGRAPRWLAQEWTVRTDDRYRALWALPRLEIESPDGSRAFHNPRIAIVDVRGDGAELAAMVPSLRARYPGLRIGSSVASR